MNKIKVLTNCLLLVLVLFAFLAPTMAQEGVDRERAGLFWSSRRLSEEREALPSRRIGLFTTTLGAKESAANLGAKLEAAVSEAVWISLEAVHRKDGALSGFLSLKLYPFYRSRIPLYVQGGAALNQSVDYQVVLGAEIKKHFFVEIKAVNADDNGVGTSPSFAAGFTLPF